jgi:hypothetical protein
MYEVQVSQIGLMLAQEEPKHVAFMYFNKL